MIDLAALGLRDYILIAAVLVGGYLLLSLLPLLRMAGKRRAATAEPAPTDQPQAVPLEPVVPRDEPRDEPRFARFAPQSLPGGDGLGAAAGDFSRELAVSSRDLEIRRLRQEMDQVQAEMTRLSEEVSAMRASRNVSPQYSEAMTLALQGVEPEGIAARCGISIGEAELVAALARGKTSDEFDEADGGRYTDNGHRHG
ncbi:MAG: DUF2802 domain-containing protein [Sulfuritalea sp.]|nr:DUF2802 domain-containing protein [Sulfuritalea sp.]